tara:strand:+ start:27958 stop:29034 length:1077 start_codon:yes stop_codon:yes gene_type:complete
MKNDKIKITFILPTLRAGGAERVMSYIAQSLDKDRFIASLLVIGFEKDAVYEVKDIDVVYFNEKRVLHAFIPIITYLKNNRPHILVSAISHLNTMMGTIGIFFPKIKFVGREVSVGSVLIKIEKSQRYYPEFLSKIAYRQLDKVICQSNDMAKDIQNKFNFRSNKLITINNPVSDNFKLKKPIDKTEVIRYITVGTLTKRKGHLRILDVLSRYSQPFNYTIVGDGIDREEIFSHAEKLGLTKKINHIPFTKDVNKYLQESDVFLQGSFVEGFPNVLLESCAVGTPVLAFKAPGGIDEIIDVGINGFIALDEEDFLRKLQLISEKNWKPEVVRESVIKRFSKTKIVKQYEDLFRSLMEE